MWAKLGRLSDLGAPSVRLGSGSTSYFVFTGEWEIGRIYQTRGGPDSLRWFCSMTVDRPMTRSGRVATRHLVSNELPWPFG